MQNRLLAFEKLRGAQRMAEIGAASEAAWNSGAVEALRKAIAAQGQRSGIRWADALSSSVRPVITYWFMALYCTAKTAACVGALDAGVAGIFVLWCGWAHSRSDNWPPWNEWPGSTTTA